ncbi:MAG: hypothetical protein VCA55_07500 [Verrucomicrobiales bacterium]
MNRNFEPIIIETYAELCIKWRLSHVANRVQAQDFDAQLSSLESVIKAFGLHTPGITETTPRTAMPPAGNEPQHKNETLAREGGGIMLED